MVSVRDERAAGDRDDLLNTRQCRRLGPHGAAERFIGISITAGVMFSSVHAIRRGYLGSLVCLDLPSFPLEPLLGEGAVQVRDRHGAHRIRDDLACPNIYGDRRVFQDHRQAHMLWRRMRYRRVIREFLVRSKTYCCFAAVVM